MTTNTSLLQKALENLHMSQQLRDQSNTPRPPSSIGSKRSAKSSKPRGESDLDDTGSVEGESASGDDSYDDDDEEMVDVGKGTRPSTPPEGGKGQTLESKKSGLSGKVGSKDPLRVLPTHLSVRIFLSLDVRSLARCDRVCKRWRKSSTLNYVWFLQNRALVLPHLSSPKQPSAGGAVRRLDPETEFFDPYEKTTRLSSLPTPSLPTTPQPQWSKAESKRLWKSVFHTTLTRSDPSYVETESGRVDIASLHSSGASTPGGGGHSHAGLGSGGAAKWSSLGLGGTDGGDLTPGERKVAAREGYKALGGRKARGKRKMGGELGGRDKGGAVDDGRFDAPW